MRYNLAKTIEGRARQVGHHYFMLPVLVTQDPKRLRHKLDEWLSIYGDEAVRSFFVALDREESALTGGMGWTMEIIKQAVDVQAEATD